MRIGRIGNFGTTPYVQSVKSPQSSPAEKVQEQEKKQQSLPGWQKRDSYERSRDNQDGSITPTGTYDYLMKSAANAARFDSENFDL